MFVCLFQETVVASSFGSACVTIISSVSAKNVQKDP